MTLQQGIKVGPYEIVGSLGAGGMGEVYRARDPRLDRSVAIKALPQGFAKDADRLARFEREARLLASLNHPNVAAIYGLEEVEGAPHLVLELIEGETLAERLLRGPLPLKDTLDVGAELAAAIEAAHARDIVHRDLKPGNVMLTESRVVKVLDFGLAKDTSAAQPSDLSASPTVAMGATSAGFILGTAGYMSPEQARGKPVDARTDIWALGCVLYECLAGRPVFSGETVSDIIARILEREPDWEALPETTPEALQSLITRCLEKDAAKRPAEVGEVRRELERIRQDLSAGIASPRRAQKKEVPSLAVLYFENLANDPDSDYFCSGITEDILTDLSKLKGLRVAAKSAVARFRGRDSDTATVAKELNVGAVLQGSVRRAGDRVRITVQLVGGSDGFQMWAERYDRTLDDVFAVQEEIASAIAEALRVTLTKDEAENLVRNRPKDVQAYDLYLRGVEEYSKYTGESLQKAIDLFNQAIAIDENYALAYAGLADGYGQLVQWGKNIPREETLAKGLECARRAIALNPKLPEAYKAEALVLRFQGRIDEAREALVKALEVNPRFSPALQNLAVDSFARGDLAACERLSRTVLETGDQDAFSMIWIAFLCRMTGRLDEAMSLAEQVSKRSHERFYATAVAITRASIALERDDDAAARAAQAKGVADGANLGNMKVIEAMLALREGRDTDARNLMSEVMGEAELLAGANMLAGEIAIRLGDTESARAMMARGNLEDLANVLVRLTPELHALLQFDEYKPRRFERPLVWPLEAPMMKPSVHALFKEVKIESGLPRGSDVSPV